MLPKTIISHLTDEFGIRVRQEQSVSGGSINRSVKLETNHGVFFLKWNPSAPEDFFEKEAGGLKRLHSASTRLRVPEVISAHPSGGDLPGFLLMEFIEEGTGGNSFVFGSELARLHKVQADQFGLDEDNFIGRLPQSNRLHDSWVTFFVEERINPQLKSAVDKGHISPSLSKNWDRLSGRLSSIFPDCKPSLLHGDLWGGNYLFDATGTAVLIDPAVYYGHPEMDLAFTHMFGGFSSEFYEGYHSNRPPEPGFSERVEIYNFYPLLVHVNLFGGGYAGQASRFLQRF